HFFAARGARVLLVDETSPVQDDHSQRCGHLGADVGAGPPQCAWARPRVEGRWDAAAGLPVAASPKAKLPPFPLDAPALVDARLDVRCAGPRVVAGPDARCEG